MIDEILGFVDKHEQWRGKECLNLIPSENIMSPAVRSLLASELGHRYTSRDAFTRAQGLWMKSNSTAKPWRKMFLERKLLTCAHFPATLQT